jgi:hypothetical protein
MFRGVVGQIRRQPVAFVALFFALGGGAMAASNVIKSNDTIGSGDLAGSLYGAPMIHSGAVTNADLANSSLTVATDGSTLTGGGLIALGASNSTPLGVAPGGIGTDQLAGGAVTNAKLANPSLTVSPGAGLTGGGSIALGGSGTLNVDPTAVQSRVNGTCSSGQAISSVNQDGTVSCAGSKVIAGVVNFNGTTSNGSGFTATRLNTGHYVLSFPAGTWSDGSFPALTMTAVGPSAILSVQGGNSGGGAASFSITASNGTSPIDSGFEFIAAQT